MDDQAPKDPFEEDVKYDQAAAEEAARRMHARGTGDRQDPDPEGGHNPEALDEAAKRMRAAERPKKK
jgi:hypothetical protein